MLLGVTAGASVQRGSPGFLPLQCRQQRLSSVWQQFWYLIFVCVNVAGWRCRLQVFLVYINSSQQLPFLCFRIEDSPLASMQQWPPKGNLARTLQLPQSTWQLKGTSFKTAHCNFHAAHCIYHLTLGYSTRPYIKPEDHSFQLKQCDLLVSFALGIVNCKGQVPVVYVG